MTIGFIYKIWNETDTYFGSTVQPLNVRLAKHKYDCKKNPKMSVNKIISKPGYKYELIEEIEFTEKKELFQIEKYYIQKYDCVNKYIPVSTREEACKRYYDKHIDVIKSKWGAMYEKRKTQTKHCDTCNIDITRNNFGAHLKSKRHLKVVKLK